MNRANSGSQTRAICPECGSNNTYAHYVHQGCPNAPTGTTTWEKEAWLGPDSRPISVPCPDCQFQVTPAYIYCRDCNHQW